MSDLRLTRAVDADNPTVHDLMIVDGDLAWVGLDPYNAEEQGRMIAQRIACRLLWIRGEWYLDQKQGTPWREVLTAKGVSTARKERTLRSVIESAPGVASVPALSVTVNHAARTATVTFRAVGDTGRQIGPVTIDVPFIVRET